MVGITVRRVSKAKSIRTLLNQFGFIFLLFLLYFFPLARAEISGSITNPALLTEPKSDDPSFFNGYFVTEFTRNIRVSKDKFLSANRQGGLFDSLYMKNDFTLSHPLDLYFSNIKNTSLFNNISAVFVLSYKRLIYATAQEIQKTCWHSVLCFSDIKLGVSKSFLAYEGRLTFKPSIYFHIPFSKSSFDSSLILGLGAGLSATYKLLPAESDFHLSVRTRHSVTRDFYRYKTANVREIDYNVPWNVFNQLGVEVGYLKYSFIPVLFFYGDYRFAINFKNTPFYFFSLNTSAVWTVFKRISIMASLHWGDRILKPKDSALVPSTQIFHPDRTFFSMGFRYSF